MAHENETRLRDAYAKFAQGDLDGYLAHCTEGITFHVPGRGKVAGTFRRDQLASPMIATVLAESNGTFRERVLDVVANDTRGVVLAEHEMERLGRRFTYQTAHVYRIEDGKLAEFREYPQDLYAFDEAWA